LNEGGFEEKNETLTSDSSGSSLSSQVTAHLMVRKGAIDNVMVWTVQADYSKTLLTGSAGSWTLNHAAAGAG